MSNEHNNAAPIAYLTEDGERCITAKTYNTARNDGGAIWSTMRPFCVPAYATLPAAAPAPAVPDVELRPEDFMVEVLVTPMGGFNPNVTHGVRVTHKPTGLSVSCDTERSQHKNRHIAFEQIKEMLADHFKITPQPPATPSQEHAVNLSCRSTQARLAAQWGYVPAPSQPAVPGVEMPLSMNQFGRLVELTREHLSDNTFVYKAKSKTGDTCHFGVESAAKAWAKGGTVEAIKVREFKLHTPPAAPSQPAVPQGWKLVPVEPTPEMGRAYLEAAKIHAAEGAEDKMRFSPGGYAAMLSAAPSQEPYKDSTPHLSEKEALR